MKIDYFVRGRELVQEVHDRVKEKYPDDIYTLSLLDYLIGYLEGGKQVAAKERR